MDFKAFLVLLVLAIDDVLLLSCLRNPAVGKWINNEKFSTSIAVYGGYEKDKDGKQYNLYICKNSGYAGKYLPYNQCNYNKIGSKNELVAHKTEFLSEVGHSVWAPVKNKKLPCNSIATEESSRDSTYIGRTYIYKFDTNNLQPGNIINGILYTSYYGLYTHNDFEVLTAVPNSLVLPVFKSSDIFETLGNYLTFKVRSEDDVSIDFGIGSDVKIRLTMGSFNIKVSGQGSISKTKQIINGSALKGFWIRWISGNSLEIGEDGIISPLAVYEGSVFKNFNTVVFSSNNKLSYWQMADLPKFKSL